MTRLEQIEALKQYREILICFTRYETEEEHKEKDKKVKNRKKYLF